MTTVAIGSDHAGFLLKAFLLEDLASRGFNVRDFGTYTDEACDYPRFCFAVGEAVGSGESVWGIVLGGTGQGEQIAANKVRGVRAALCNDPYHAELARRINDANVLAMGARIIAPEMSVAILDAWCATAFSGGRQKRRVRQISDYEQRATELP